MSVAHQLASAGDDPPGGESGCKHVESSRGDGGCGGRSVGTQVARRVFRISNVRSMRGMNHMHWIVLHHRFTTEPRTKNHIFIQHLSLLSSEASELIASFKSSLTATLLSHG